VNASIDFISTTIGDIADVISGPFGSQLHESDYKDQGTPIVTVEHLSPYGLTTQNLPFVGDEDKERLNRYTLRKGDIVFSRVGSVDRCSLVSEKEEGWLFSGRLLRIRLNKNGKEMATLLSYIFQTNRFTHQVRSKAVGQTMPSLNNGIVKSLQVSIPRNSELQKIYCDILINVDQKINLLTKKKEALETYKKGLMQKIFSQELRFKREDGTDYPEWESKVLSEVAEIQKGKQLNKLDMDENGAYPVLNGGINWSGFTTSYNTLANTIAISEGGNSCGYVSFVTTDFWSGGHNYTLELQNDLEVKYLYHFLKYKEVDIKSLRVGSGLPNIQKKDLKRFFCDIPCLEEQRSIIYILDNLDSQIDITTKKIDSSERMKKGLLQQMFV